MEQDWAREVPSGVKKLAEAWSPSLTIGENELRSKVDCISFAIPSSLWRTTSTVMGSSAWSRSRAGLVIKRLPSVGSQYKGPVLGHNRLPAGFHQDRGIGL